MLVHFEDYKSTFANVRDLQEYLPDVTVPELGYPSEYVYESCKSNRIADTTVSMYQVADENRTGASLWNAENYARARVLIKGRENHSACGWNCDGVDKEDSPCLAV